MKTEIHKLLNTSIVNSISVWKLPKSIYEVIVLDLGGSIISDIDFLKLEYTIKLVRSMYGSLCLMIDTLNSSITLEQQLQLQERLNTYFSHCFLVSQIGIDIKSNAKNEFQSAQLEVISQLRKYRVDGGKKLNISNKGFDLQQIKPRYISIGSTSIQFGFEFEDNILQVNFSGEYPHGSSGDEMGQEMSIILDFCFEYFRPQKLIVDMTDLSYEWGDKFCYLPFEVDVNDNIPFRLIVSDRNESGIRSLFPNEKRISYSMENARNELMR